MVSDSVKPENQTDKGRAVRGDTEHQARFQNLQDHQKGHEETNKDERESEGQRCRGTHEALS